MLSQSQVTCMLPVKDLSRARRFYEERLGLEPHGLRPDGKFIYRVGAPRWRCFRSRRTKSRAHGVEFQGGASATP